MEIHLKGDYTFHHTSNNHYNYTAHKTWKELKEEIPILSEIPKTIFKYVLVNPSDIYSLRKIYDADIWQQYRFLDNNIEKFDKYLTNNSLTIEQAKDLITHDLSDFVIANIRYNNEYSFPLIELLKPKQKKQIISYMKNKFKKLNYTDGLEELAKYE